MKALYRKYRPTTLDHLVGEPEVVNTLKSVLKSGNFSHAYLFTGPRGCGKTSAARIFAHEINGFKYELEDNYPDIIEIDAASNTGVDNIRDLREKAIISPTEGKYKVYIIDEVHMLSKSAFNALLKLIEEPPEHVVFIMATTDFYKVPVTIVSRVHKLEFKLAQPDTMSAHLAKIAEQEGINIDKAAIDTIVLRGGGSFRDSISLLDQISSLSDHITEETVVKAIGVPEQKVINNLLVAYEAGDAGTITNILQNLLSIGSRPETIAESVIRIIMQNPRPTLLPLLEKLPEVSGSFSEAKLTLAFLGQTAILPSFKAVSMGQPAVYQAPAAPTAQPNPAPVPDTHKKGPSISERFKAAKAQKQATPKNFDELMKQKDEKPSTKPQIAETASLDFTKAPEPLTQETFTWDKFLDYVRRSSMTVANYLAKSSIKQEENTITVITATKMQKTILDKPNNRAVIDKYTPDGINIIVISSDETETSASDSVQNSQIRDIMGDIQEVKTDGVPFD